MAFLNPALLFGLAAVAVPIIIHLLNRRRFQRIEWGAMRFLRAAVEQNRRRLRIEDLLLLAVRCLLVVLVALALARPALRSASFSLFGRAHVTAVIVLDATASMQRTDGVSSAFDRARRAADEIVESLPPGSAAAVWTATDAVVPLIPEPTFDLALARRVIRDARPTDRAGELLPAVQRAVEAFQGRTGPGRELYVVTDGQAPAWRGLDAIRALLRGPLGGDVRTRVVLVGDGGEDNVAITDLRPSPGPTVADRPLRFDVTVANPGRREAREVRVTLAADAAPPADETVVVLLRPGESRTVSLVARLREPGFHTVTARIPDDRQPADDRRTLAVRAPDAVRVLLVEGDSGGPGRAGSGFFLRHALAPEGASIVRVAVLPAAEFVPSALAAADAVALVDVPDLDPAAAGSLRKHVESGGGLLVFPGPRVNRAFYNDVLGARLGLLPAALGEPQGDAGAREQGRTLQDRGHEHPVAALWNDPAAGTLSGARFYRWFPLEPVSGAAAGAEPEGRSRAASTIVRYADGAPAVVEREAGRGRVVLFGSTADTAWNDLPARPAFVPLVHRALGWAVARRDEALNVRAGRVFAWPAGSERIGRAAAFIVPGPDGPVRQSREMDVVDGQAVARCEATDLAGGYELAVTGDPPLAIRFAVQPDPDESSVDVLAPRQRETVADAAKVTSWAGEGSLREEIRAGRVGSELWKPLAALAAALGALETWLAHAFTRPRRS